MLPDLKFYLYGLWKICHFKNPKILKKNKTEIDNNNKFKI
jgi:hypothetical protein